MQGLDCLLLLIYKRECTKVAERALLRKEGSRGSEFKTHVNLKTFPGIVNT